MAICTLRGDATLCIDLLFIFLLIFLNFAPHLYKIQFLPVTNNK